MSNLTSELALLLDFPLSFFLRGLSDRVGGFNATSLGLVAWSSLVPSGLVGLGWWLVPGIGWLPGGLVLVWVVGLVGCIGSIEGEGCWFWLSFNIGGFSLIISFFPQHHPQHLPLVPTLNL